MTKEKAFFVAVVTKKGTLLLAGIFFFAIFADAILKPILNYEKDKTPSYRWPGISSHPVWCPE
ncbi:MAG: hypothetical protein IJP74_03335 [Prevotella sp.]|nr:hypothetical protein [Prevotella sp.]